MIIVCFHGKNQLWMMINDLIFCVEFWKLSHLMWLYVCFKKTNDTYAKVCSSKCVIVFLKPMLFQAEKKIDVVTSRANAQNNIKIFKVVILNENSCSACNKSYFSKLEISHMHSRYPSCDNSQKVTWADTFLAANLGWRTYWPVPIPEWF